MHSQAMWTYSGEFWKANSALNSGDSTASYQMLDSGTLCTTLMFGSIEANTRFILHSMSKSEDQVDLQRVSDCFSSEKPLVYFLERVRWTSTLKPDL